MQVWGVGEGVTEGLILSMVGVGSVVAVDVGTCKPSNGLHPDTINARVQATKKTTLNNLRVWVLIIALPCAMHRAGSVVANVLQAHT